MIIMNKRSLFISLFAACLAISLGGCIKEKNVTFTSAVAEFDAAAYNTVFGSLTYPLVTRHPTPGRAILTADSFITRRSNVASFRINLVGAQRSTPVTVMYQVFAVGTAVGSSITYGAPVSGTLTTFDALPGSHFTALSGTVTIPANSSFTTLSVPIINSGISNTTTALLGLELITGGDIPPSENYKKIAFAISQK
jgi:hypothetical protein